MVLLAHTLTGAVIGVKIKSSIIVIILSFVSHFILDRIPHKNLPIPKKPEPFHLIRALPDVLPSIAIYFAFLYFHPEHWINITLGVAFAILVDFISLFRLIPKLNGLLKWLYDLHDKVQGKAALLTGIFIQITYIAFLLAACVVSPSQPTPYMASLTVE